MNRNTHKKLGLDGLFSDFKHHAKSWKNSKRMRAKRERQRLKAKEDEDGKEAHKEVHH